MAIVKCRECENEVSTQARSCPQCGAPFPAKPEWRGTGYEWKSEATYLGWPLVHVAWGRDEHGRLRVAKGVIAIGQFAIGAITIAQFGIGLVFGFGQFILGLTAIAQFAAGAYLGVGQFAAGYVAIGQFAFGHFALGLAAAGRYVWTVDQADPQAVEFFRQLGRTVRWPGA